MSGEAMAQRMWMDGFFQARALSGLLASVTRRFRIDGLITVVPTVAWKQPSAGLSRQAAPVLAQFPAQFWAEHHIPAFAPLAASAVNPHPPTVATADLQARQFAPPQAVRVGRDREGPRKS